MAHGSDDFPFQCYDTVCDWKRQDNVTWHWHKELELFILKSEAIICQIAGHTLHLEKGNCILINSSVLHQYHAPETQPFEENGRWINILFSPDFIAPKNSSIYKNTVYPVLTSGVEYFDFRQNIGWKADVRKMIDDLCDICFKSCDMQELSIHIILSKIWKELYIHLPNTNTSNTLNKNLMLQSRLRVMLQYIWDNFAQPIHVKDIADAANISISMAQRCFRFCINDSPNHYLQQYRLEHAKELLQTTNLSIIDIALSSGFGNVSHFNHLFKREFGITPKQYIKQQSQPHK